MIAIPSQVVRRAVDAALEEDLGPGDLTTDALIPEQARATAHIVARQDLVVAGLHVASQVFRRLDPGVAFERLRDEGQRARTGARLAALQGSARAILRGERTALNFLMRMCGIATAARAAVDEVRGTRARILDTRKTAPGLRWIDKYAVAAGGALNHRMGLYDAVMIKDTHVAICDSLADAVARARAAGHEPRSIIAEVRDTVELQQAIEAGAGRVLLDNMAPEQLREAVALARGRVVLEASGGLRPGQLRAFAETGVDFLSVGALTHSAQAADLALEIEVRR